MTDQLCATLAALPVESSNPVDAGIGFTAAYAEVIVTLPASVGQRLPAEQIEEIRERISRFLEQKVAPSAKVILLVNPGEIQPHVSVFLLVTDGDAIEDSCRSAVQRLTPNLELMGPVTVAPIGDTPTRTLTDVEVTHRVDLRLIERSDGQGEAA